MARDSDYPQSVRPERPRERPQTEILNLFAGADHLWMVWLGGVPLGLAMPLTERTKDLSRRRLKAALLGIIYGVGLTDREGHPTIVPVRISLRMAAIVAALRDAVEHLNEDFDSQDLRTVDSACKALGVQRTTDRKDKVAKAILDILLLETNNRQEATLLAEFEPGSAHDGSNRSSGLVEPTERSSQLKPRTIVWLAIAIIPILTVETGLIINFYLRNEPLSRTYQTASAPSKAGSGAHVLLRFAPQASAGELTRFLLTKRFVIVEGPTAGGIFKVRIGEKHLPAPELEQLAKTLQGGHEIVRFAAPTE
jgi:hypothetical protein